MIETLTTEKINKLLMDCPAHNHETGIGMRPDKCIRCELVQTLGEIKKLEKIHTGPKPE